MKKEMTRSQSNNARVEFHKHPPERRCRGEGRLYCSGGCCCCCCCLHSLGGLIGAAVASRRKQGVLGGPEIGRYWGFLTLLACVTIILSAVFGAIGFAIFMVMMAMPAIQLVCSAVTTIWVKVSGENVADESASLWTVGKITLWSFLGAVVGVLAMILLFQMRK